VFTEKPVDGGRGDSKIHRQKLSDSGLTKDDGKRRSPHLRLEIEERLERLFVQGPEGAFVGSSLRVEAGETTPRLLVSLDPFCDCGLTDPVSAGIRDLPFLGGLFPQKPASLSPGQLPPAHKIGDHSKTELRDAFFALCTHDVLLFLGFRTSYRTKKAAVTAKTGWGASPSPGLSH